MNIAAMGSRSKASVTWMGTEYRTTLTKTDSAGLLGMFESRVPGPLISTVKRSQFDLGAAFT